MTRILAKQLVVGARQFLDSRESSSKASQRKVTCDGSQRTRLTSRVVSEGLLHQPVQLAGCCVSLDLAVPLHPVLLEKPVPQLCELIGVEFRDLLFELFDSGHGSLENKTRDS